MALRLAVYPARANPIPYHCSHPTPISVHPHRTPSHRPTNQSGIEYFPESGKEAAPEAAKALLHAFVNKLGQSAIPNAPPAFSLDFHGMEIDDWR